MKIVSHQQILFLTLCSLLQLPPAVQGGGQYSYSEAMSGDGAAPRRFPKLDEEIFNTHYEDLELRWKGPASTSLLDAMGYEDLYVSFI